tara:strand:+ start:912 stop:1298 length:387 start_codon:yes stop_codon:yes gene_type:complete
MKKYIYLFITVFLFSCAGNDDIIGNEIAGNWKLTAVLVDGSPVNTSCELESNMTMLETNTGNYYKYDEDDSTTNSCLLEQNYMVTWCQVLSTYYITFVADNDTFTADLNGNTLIIHASNGSEIVLTKN